MKDKALYLLVVMLLIVGVLLSKHPSNIRAIAVNSKTVPSSKTKPLLAWSKLRNSAATVAVASPRQNISSDLVERIRIALLAGDTAGHDLVFTNLLGLLVDEDPWAASNFAESLTDEATQQEFMRRLAQLWTARDSASAESWAAQLSDEKERDLAMDSVCFQIAQTDAHQALQTAEKYNFETPEALENLAQQWVQQDFSGASAWIEQLPAGEERNQMISRLAEVESQMNPADAARMVADEIPPGWDQTEAAILIVQQWGQRDMAGAKAWVAMFPNGPIRDRAEYELAGIAAYQNAQPENRD